MEPSLSEEVEPSKVTVSGLEPLVDVAIMTAFGATLAASAVTTTGVEAELASPLLSVTVNTVEYVPADVKEWVAVVPKAMAPSPKLQE